MIDTNEAQVRTPTYSVFFDAAGLEPAKRLTALAATYAALSELVEPGGRYCFHYDCGGEGWLLSLREVHRCEDRIECVLVPWQKGAGSPDVSERTLKKLLKTALIKVAREKLHDPATATMAEVMDAVHAAGWARVVREPSQVGEA